MKRLIIGLVVAATAAITPNVDAAADKPITFPAGVFLEGETNPCTGEEIDVTIDFEVTVHQHKKNGVFIVKTTVSQSDGWSGGGTDTVVVSERGTIETVNLRTSSPDGDRFFVRKYVLKTGADGSASLDRLTFECRR